MTNKMTNYILKQKQNRLCLLKVTPFLTLAVHKHILSMESPRGVNTLICIQRGKMLNKLHPIFSESVCVLFLFRKLHVTGS